MSLMKNRISKKILATFLIVLIASCTSVKRTAPPDEAEEIPTSLPAYYGTKQRILIYPWNISKVDLEKYPYLRQKRIGFGINNRMFETLYQSGRFDLIEEKESVSSRLTGDKTPDYDYIVYPEVYHFGIEQDSDISGVTVSARNVTELGVQIVFVNAKTGVTATVGSAIGSVVKTAEGSIVDELERTAFSQSTVGKAAEKAVVGALAIALARLNVPPGTVTAPIRQDISDNKVRQPETVSTSFPATKQSVIVRHADAGKDRHAPLPFKTGRFHAFIIGNNEYRVLPKLETAQSDAEKVEHMLREQYGFETQLLLNGTRQTIIDRLDKLRGELDENDNLLIYYAGHGYYDAGAERGYWLPVNAGAENTAEWISNPDITDKIKVLKARHVIVVADSCFSGTLTRDVKINLGGEVSSGNPYLQRMNDKRSRTVLASGGVEPVLDGGGGGNSVFAKAFLEVLAENEAALDGTAFFNAIRRRVTVSSQQTPEYSDIRFAGHDGGDFLFLKRAAD